MVSNLYKEKVSAIIAKAKERGAIKSYSEFCKTNKGKEAALSKDEIIVYELIKRGMLPALKLGSFKIRRSALLEFLEKYEGQDLTDLNNIKDFEMEENK